MEKRIKLIISLAMCFIMSSYSVCVYALGYVQDGSSFTVTVGKGHSSVTGEGNKEQTGGPSTGNLGHSGSNVLEGTTKGYFQQQHYDPFTSVGTDTGAVIVNKGYLDKNVLYTNLDAYYSSFPNEGSGAPIHKDYELMGSNESAQTEDAKHVFDNITGGYNNNGTMNPGLIFNNTNSDVPTIGDLGIKDYPSYAGRFKVIEDYITHTCITDTVEVYQIKEYKYTSIEQNKLYSDEFMENYALYVYKADSPTDYDCIDNPDNYITSAIHSGQQFTFSPASAGFYALMGLQEYEKSTRHEYKVHMNEYYVIAETGDILYKTNDYFSRTRGYETISYWRQDNKVPVIVELSAHQMAVMWITPNGVVLDLGTTERIE